MGARGSSPVHDRLWEIYRDAGAAVEKQVDRTWSLSQFFLTLDATVLAAAFALLQWRSTPIALVVIALLLVAGAGIAFIGLRMLQQNKRYYRALSYKRFLIADELGLAERLTRNSDSIYAVPIVGVNMTTRKLEEMRLGRDEYVDDEMRPGSQTDWMRWIFRGFIAVDVVSAVLLVALAISCGLGGFACLPPA